MKNKSIKNKIIAGLIMASMVISSSSLAFAADNGPSGNGTKTQLDALVTAGTITEDIETAVLNLLKPADGQAAPSNNQGQGMPTDGQGGGTTDGQGTPADGQKGPGGGMKNQIDALVTDGTITEDQETSINQALEAATEKSEAGTQAALDALVSVGTITADQETAVINALKPADGQGGPGGQGGAADTQGAPTDTQGAAGNGQGNPNDKLKTQLDDMVSAGTITTDQETAILNALKPQDNGGQKGPSGQGAPKDAKGKAGNQGK